MLEQYSFNGIAIIMSSISELAFLLFLDSTRKKQKSSDTAQKGEV